MRFKIPANTELEDKILPFLSIRQLAILATWATISYLFFHILYWLWYIAPVWWTIDVIIMWFTLAFAFLKINHLEFHRWFTLLISKIFIPQKRFFNNWLVWSQNFDVLNISISDKNKAANKKSEEKKIANEEIQKNNLDEMKNQIFWNSEKKSFDNSNLEVDEIDEFNRRFW